MSETQAGHGKQSIPYEWAVAQIHGDRYIVRDVPEGVAELYRVIGSSRCIRVLARAEAVILEGHVLEPNYEHDIRRVSFHHDFAGKRDAFPIETWLRRPASMLERVRVATHLLDFPEESGEQ